VVSVRGEELATLLPRDVFGEISFALARPATADVVAKMYAVRARETDRGYSGREDLWFIVAVRSGDEAAIRAGETGGGRGR